MTVNRIQKMSDVIDVVKARVGILDTQTDKIEALKSFIGQKYDEICGERNWNWRIFDRSFSIKEGEDGGTASLTYDSREVVLSDFTLASTHFGKSIQFGTNSELYRIVAVNVAEDKIILESPYTGETEADASFTIYTYEFPLPFDCDEIISVNISGGAQIDEFNPIEFKRLFNGSPTGTTPYAYCRYGLTLDPNTLIPNLGEWVLNYDFLAKNDNSGEYGDKLAIFPYNPNKTYKIDIQYSKNTNGYEGDSVPIMPANDRWVLVDFAMAQHYLSLGQFQTSSMYMSNAEKRLKKMRSEFKGAQSKVKAVISADRYMRASG